MIITHWLTLAVREGAISASAAEADRRRTPALYWLARAHAMRLFDAWYERAVVQAHRSAATVDGSRRTDHASA